MSGFDKVLEDASFKEPWPGWSDGISGYEACCQAMLTAALGALIAAKGRWSEAVHSAMVKAGDEHGGATGAQAGTAKRHALFITVYGYEKWIEGGEKQADDRIMEIEDYDRGKYIRQLERLRRRGELFTEYATKGD
ncbi:MAG: hypothetical protein GTO63_34295 [Anaerolineae bacterium]|nr:hypothetical protein [Anaerolineae bacterium]